MPFAWAGLAGSVIGAGTSIYGATQAGSQGAAVADPFASQRPQYQAQLSQLFADPSSISKTPGYQFQFDQGMQALERTQAGQGAFHSGQTDTAAIQFGQGLAETSFKGWEQMLAELSGATIGSPGIAGQLTAGGIQGGYQGLSQGLGSIFSSLGNIQTQQPGSYGSYTYNPNTSSGINPNYGPS